MSDFKTKMHQIRFPLELRPGPLAVFKGAYFKGKGRKGRVRRTLSQITGHVTETQALTKLYLWGGAPTP